MIVVVLTAWALGADVRRLLVLVAALLWPVALVGLVVLALWSTRRDRMPRSALFCEAVSAELRAGLPLRGSLMQAMVSVGCQPLPGLAVAPLSEVATGVAGEFQDVEVELEMTIAAAARAGGVSADLFREIGSLAIARSEVEHEVKVAVSPARATAFVFFAVPTAYLVARLNSGSLAALVASSSQRVAGLLGVVLFVLGLLIAGLVLWRGR